MAVAAGAIIIGFNVRPAGKAASLAQKEEVQIRHYTIIYNVVDEVKAAMEGLLAPTMVEKNIGKAEIRQVFKTSKAGAVAGCMVIEGVIKRSGGARLLRDGASIWQGKIGGLKRFKDDAKDVKEGSSAVSASTASLSSKRATSSRRSRSKKSNRRSSPVPLHGPALSLIFPSGAQLPAPGSEFLGPPPSGLGPYPKHSRFGILSGQVECSSEY